MDNKRPRARQKNVTSGGSGVHRRGSGLGTGPVGSGKINSGKTGGSGMKRAAVGGGISIPTLLIIGFAIMKMLGGGGNGASQQQQDFIQNNNNSFSGVDFSDTGSSAQIDNSVAAG